MNKKLIAVVFGGKSPEYEVSLQSAYSVLENFPKEYDLIKIGISREGNWFLFTGENELIKSDKWLNGAVAVTFSLSGGSPAIIYGDVRVIPDALFPVLHGRNGEDGTVQALARLMNIKLIGCGVESSALCMDKHRAHLLAKAEGVDVPKSVLLRENSPIPQVGFPVVVKPLRAGSSFGVSKVGNCEELTNALKIAFQYDDQAVVEEFIDGREVGCAVTGSNKPKVYTIDMIDSAGAVFDFNKKYAAEAAVITPAPLSDEITAKIKETAVKLYTIFGCEGFARVDMFLTSDNKIIFNEINTIPGFTEHSRFPKMLAAAGQGLGEALGEIVKECL